MNNKQAIRAILSQATTLALPLFIVNITFLLILIALYLANPG
jgi:hypothetical protein